MNKKGFTVVETMAAFLLISTISVLLFELFVSLQMLYNRGEIQTRLLINQANFQRRIEQDLANSNDVTIAECGTNCIRFTLDGLEKDLKVQNGNLFYDNYALKEVKGTKIGDFNYQTVDASLSNSGGATITSIRVPLINDIVNEDFGIHIVYQTL